MKKNKGRENPYILANVLKAFIASLYLAGGIDVTRDFIAKDLLNTASDPQKVSSYWPKSHLQELTQEHFGCLPEYILTAESGPDHDHIYEMNIVLNGKMIGQGSSSSKRKAQQEAAKDALSKKSEWMKEKLSKNPIVWNRRGCKHLAVQGRIIQSWPESLPNWGKNKSIIAYNNLFVK